MLFLWPKCVLYHVVGCLRKNGTKSREKYKNLIFLALAEPGCPGGGIEPNNILH